MSLTDKEKAYVDNAFVKLNKDIDRFEKFLKDNMKGGELKIKELVLYFQELLDEEVTPLEEEVFKKEVEKYNEEKEHINEMSWGERRKFKKKYKDVINWLGEVQKLVEKYSEIMQSTKNKRKQINSLAADEYLEKNEEAEKLRLETIEAILMANDLLVIEDPNTGKEATYDSLVECNIDQLVQLMEDNVFELNDFLNRGVIRE